MVRQYKIHTNLDGSDNQIIDLTRGKIRLYQPSDLGIVTNTNIWSSQGLGVFGDTAVSHPSMDFRLETFGDDLKENYNLINEFVSKILAQKYVTIEYTSEQGTYYADVKLAKVSKTEGYGQNGTFSETISFDVINKWYTYQQLKFSKFSNGKLDENTKIHADALKKNTNLLDFDSVNLGQFLDCSTGTLNSNPNRAAFYYMQVTASEIYSLSSDWSKTTWLSVFAYGSKSDEKATYIYDGTVNKWVDLSTNVRFITKNTTITIPQGINFVRISFLSSDTAKPLTLKYLLDSKPKFENGLAVEKMKGGNVTIFERKSASEIDIHAKKMGLNTITYPIKVIVADASSNDMSIDSENYEYGVSVINELIKRGYSIIIEPYPFIAAGTVGETEWNPSNKTTWFENWKKVVEKIASLANSLNCKYYVASNLVKIESESDKWVSLIRYLKAKYTAKLIYRTNWWVTASWAPETITAYNAKLNNPIFGEVDEIAIAGYFELTDDETPTIETLKQAIKSTTKYNRQQNVFEEVKAFYTKWNKPVFFGELGIAPYKKASGTPWKYEYDANDYYEEVQANWYQAWIETFKFEDWFSGFSIFVVATQDNMFAVTKTGKKTLRTLFSTGTAARYAYSDTSYIYSTEENIDRFSKWLIEENIFSFVARLTPSKNVENKKYGLRFLNSDANEYSAIVFNLPQVADVIQLNTDSNDEYYQAIFNGQAVNMFSALDFQRFRTRLFEKGSMELIGLDSVEMNVKRKVDFV